MLAYEDDDQTKVISGDDGGGYSYTETVSAPSGATTEPVVTNAPSMPGGGSTTPESASTGAAYGGTGAYGDLSYADAVQAAYRAQQERMNATGVEEAPIDFSMAGLSEAGLWGMSQADKDANAARKQAILDDPNTVDAIRDLVNMPGYGTPEFDRSLNDGSNPSLLATVQGYLGLAQEQNATGDPSFSGSGTYAAGGSSGGTTSISDGGSTINRLIDVAAAMYAGAGVKGGGTGFGGLVAAPISGTTTQSGGKKSSTGIVILLVLGAALAFWYYKKHHKKASA